MRRRRGRIRSRRLLAVQPEKSEVVRRVTTTDEDDVMPPVKTKKKLTQKQIALLQQWISEGAEYELHWAYQPPVKSALPAIKTGSGRRMRLINLFWRGWRRKVWRRRPEADAGTLARRVALDLTGLPPTPEMVQAFLKDRSPMRYENYVDRLLESSAYGEHRAR